MIRRIPLGTWNTLSPGLWLWVHARNSAAKSERNAKVEPFRLLSLLWHNLMNGTPSLDRGLVSGA